MKKKGFTLIELLAVIVVLAIIAVIATPMVLNTIEDAKKGAAKSSTLMMVDAARLYHARQSMDPINQFQGFECSISDGKGCDELSLKGQKPDKGIITISDKGIVNGKTVFGKYTYYICNDKVSEEETAGCSVTDYSLIFNITNEGIITGFKNKEEAAFFTIIEEVNASELTDEAKEVIESKTLTIPEYVGDVEVTGIGANAFVSYEIEKVTILPSKRITIGENALPENLGKLRVSECSSRHYSEYEDILETFKSTCTIQEYTITYDLNGGTGDIPVQYKEEGVDIVLTTSAPTKSGYNFIGWATTSDATSAEYTSGATYTNDSDVTLYAVWGAYKCIRATELHKETCNNTSTNSYCSGYGYSKGSTITYGNQTITENTLKRGDPFTCDVDGNNEYNETTERFYYVTDLSSNSDYAVLIYYSSTNKGQIDSTTSSTKAYNSNGTNYNGPVTAKTHLPKTSQWTNISLSSPTRAILNEKGGTTGGSYNLTSAFSYDGYAARLLTYKEVSTACGGMSKIPNNCQFLLENTSFSSATTSSVEGYWLETPRADSTDAVWRIAASSGYGSANVSGTSTMVRPAIEVLKTDMDY